MLATPRHVRAGLLVALLHDVGHYPLSHMFEDFTDKRLAGADQILSDDALFESLVCTDTEKDLFREEVEKQLRALGVRESLGELINRLFPGSTELLHELMYPGRKAPVSVGLLRAIINSAIDADKVAYLGDDSSATGVPFGHGIDLTGLIDALVPPRGSDANRAVIAIREEGLAAAESVVLSRFWMISRVYWHRTNRAIMAMHKFVIAHLLKSNFSFLTYFARTLFGSQGAATDVLSDMYDESWKGSQIPQAKNPLTGLRGASRQIYDRLLTVSRSNAKDSDDETLYKHIVAEKPTAVLDLGEEIREYLNKNVRDLGLVYGNVAMDAPYKPRDELGYNVLVYLDRAPEQGIWLSGADSVSPMLRNLNDDFEQNVKKCRVFVHPGAMGKMRELGVIDRAKGCVRECLAERYRR